MVTSPSSRLTVVTATALETRAVARAAPGMHLIEVGIGLSRIRSDELGDVVVTCGLAGGLRRDAATGTVVVPESVTGPTGETIVCDRELVDALVRAGQRYVKDVERGPLITREVLVTGPARETWAKRGYVAADMETGFIKARRLAAIRVILDTPQRELSEAWLHPASVLARPHIWPQAFWLWREGPRCAQLAADVLAAAFASP